MVFSNELTYCAMPGEEIHPRISYYILFSMDAIGLMTLAGKTNFVSKTH